MACASLPYSGDMHAELIKTAGFRRRVPLIFHVHRRSTVRVRTYPDLRRSILRLGAFTDWALTIPSSGMFTFMRPGPSY